MEIPVGEIRTVMKRAGLRPAKPARGAYGEYRIDSCYLPLTVLVYEDDENETGLMLGVEREGGPTIWTDTIQGLEEALERCVEEECQ